MKTFTLISTIVLIGIILFPTSATALPLKVGLAGEVAFPDTILLFDGISELSVTETIGLRTTLTTGSLFGVWLLAVEAQVLVQTGGKFNTFFGLGGGYSRMESRFGSDTQQFFSGVTGVKVDLGPTALVAQLKVTNLTGAPTYQVGLGLLF